MPSFAAVTVVALATRGLAIALFPVMPYGDGYARIVDPRRLLLHDWLPGYQASLAATSWFSTEPTAFRLVTALQGALAAGTATLLFPGRRAAGVAVGLFIALSPVYVLPSVGLYQESLFLLFLFTALGALASGARRVFGVGAFAAACLTRYEAWLFVPFVAATLPVRWWPALAIGPVSWLLARGGFAVDPELSGTRVLSYARVMRGLLPYWFGLPMLALASWGSSRLRRSTLQEGALLWGALASVAYVMVAQPFSPPENARQLVLPGLGLLSLSVIALPDRLLAVVPLLALASLGRVYADARDWYGTGEVAVAAEIGRSLHDELEPGRRASVVGSPDACEVIAVYARAAPGAIACGVAGADVVIDVGSAARAGEGAR